MNAWTDDHESVLKAIHINSIKLMNEHKRRHFSLKDSLKYFRIPTIIISAVNSVFSVGLQPYMEQGLISVINCMLSLLAGIIVSIELFLSVEKQAGEELISSKEYYILGANIQKELRLDRENRAVQPRPFLDEMYGEYCKLYQKSCLLDKRITDCLVDPQAQSGSTTPVSSKLNFGLELHQLGDEEDGSIRH
jgi:hypothetical protein